jgi:hypothetical protein
MARSTSVTGRPLTVRTDRAHGGRWTSLTTPEREWLWRNPRVTDAARAAVAPGSPFADAGGVEECFPTINGPSDHGQVWSQAWAVSAGADRVARGRAGELGLHRRLGAHDGVVRAGYTIDGRPGAGPLYAVHILFDVGHSARLEVPGQLDTLVVEWPESGRTVPAT